MIGKTRPISIRLATSEIEQLHARASALSANLTAHRLGRIGEQQDSEAIRQRVLGDAFHARTLGDSPRHRGDRKRPGKGKQDEQGGARVRETDRHGFGRKRKRR